MHVLCLGDSIEGRRNIAHVNVYSRVEFRLGGRDVIPAGAWPILMLRGVSQPTPNVPEVPRAIGVLSDSYLDVPSDHARRCFDVSEVLDTQHIPVFAT